MGDNTINGKNEVKPEYTTRLATMDDFQFVLDGNLEIYEIQEVRERAIIEDVCINSLPMRR